MASHIRGAAPAGEAPARQLQVAELIAQGKRNREIAAALGLTEGTIKVYVSALLLRLGLAIRTQIALWWHKRPSK